MDDLYQELRAKMRQAEASLKALKQNGIEKARTEQEYQVKKRQEYLKRKDNGEAVTMINETIKAFRTSQKPVLRGTSPRSYMMLTFQR